MTPFRQVMILFFADIYKGISVIINFLVFRCINKKAEFTYLTDQIYRERILENIIDPEILAFWKKEYDKMSPSARLTAIAPILNKIGIFHSSVLKNVFGTSNTTINMQEIMDTKKIFIANLAKGQIGEEATQILGSLITTSFMNAALHRSTIPENQRIPFSLYLDECGSLVNSSLAEILSECRKFGLSLNMFNQYLFQLDKSIQEAIFGNVGTIISFRVGSSDAPRLAREFSPYFDSQDLQNLNQYNFYCKLCIDGITSKPFSAKSLTL